MKKIYLILLISVLGLCLNYCSSDDDDDDDDVQTFTISQNDWAGGPGVLGPLSDWSNRFYEASDIAWSTGSGGLMLGPGVAQLHDVTTTFGEPAGVISADLDGDMDEDIIAVAFSGDEVSWFENDGSGGGWEKHVIGSNFIGVVSLCAVDLDGDNDLDIAATAEEGHSICWWANGGSGGDWTETMIDGSIHGPFSVQAADLDADGDQDLVSAIFNDSQVIWYENLDGLGTLFAKNILPGNAAGAWCAVVQDIDGDHDQDIVAVTFSDNSVVWYANNGDASEWTQNIIDNNFPHPDHLRAEDINGDQYIDVAAVSYSGHLAWWENDGAGGWVKHEVDSTLNQPFSIRIEDLDGDGDRDLLTNERNADRILWYENTLGSGELWLQHLIDESGDGPNDVSVGHIENNGALNVLASFSWDNTIRWYRLDGMYASTGTLESSILDLGTQVQNWQEIEWECEIPSETSIKVDVRGSTDSANMGEWATVAASGNMLSDYLSGSNQYFQYRLTFQSNEVTQSPQLEVITIRWQN